jgi:hypothetical protein
VIDVVDLVEHKQRFHRLRPSHSAWLYIGVWPP